MGNFKRRISASTSESVCVNVGCGRTPVQGWNNYDSSPSVKLASRPLLTKILANFGKVNEDQQKFINFAKHSDIKFANAIVRLPEADNSVDVVYSCHMVEHLERGEALKFFAETRRILKPGGIIRLAVPNIRWHIDNFLEDNDADKFIEKIKLTRVLPKTMMGRLRALMIGDRSHRWMYDGSSICKLLTEAGFENACELEAGETMIPNPGDLNLRERAPESVFAEAYNK